MKPTQNLNTLSHSMFDLYDCQNHMTGKDDLMPLFDLADSTLRDLGLTALQKPTLLPYFYSNESFGGGISLYVLLDFGHFTLHTFSKLKCVFIDLFCAKKIDIAALTKRLGKEFATSDAIYYQSNRRNNKVLSNSPAANREKDFGPHYLSFIKSPLEFKQIYDIVANLPAAAQMTPIMLPAIVETHTSISALTMIAESHIALHYHKPTNEVFLDLFSCKFIPDGIIEKLIEETINKNAQTHLITRGQKFKNI